MKVNISSVIAIIISLAAVSFTSLNEANNKAGFGIVYFQYIPPTPGDYSKASVENNSNWIEVLNLTTGCDNIDGKACRISIDDSFTQGTSPNRGLVSWTVIFAAPFNSTSFYVTSSGSLLAKRNKS